MTEYFVRWKFGPNSLLNRLDTETSWYYQFHKNKEDGVAHYTSLLLNSTLSEAMTVEIFKMTQLIPGQEELEENSRIDTLLEEFAEIEEEKKQQKLSVNGERNKKILKMFKAGQTRREIADKLDLSYQTVYAVTREPR